MDRPSGPSRTSRYLPTILLLVGVMLALAACSGSDGSDGSTGEAGAAGPAGEVGPAGPAGPAGEVSATDLSCTECHVEGTLIVSKQAQFHRSQHGSGEAYLRGGSASCAGCHGSESAEARIEAGLVPRDEAVEGVINVSPYTCRTCHDIHTTYTEADFSLTGDAAPPPMMVTAGAFDGGLGNLCANCHQIRNELPEFVDGMLELTSSRFGTHHGVEAQMMLGEGGLGVTGSPGDHYEKVDDTCVTCHMGENRNHTWVPNVDNCQSCHEDLESFDSDGVQTEVEALIDEAKVLLVASGMMTEENRSVPGTYTEEVASAMWNYMFVIEDASNGVHNPDFAKALLEYVIENLG